MNAARWRQAPLAHRAMLVGALTTAMFAGAWNVAQSQNEPTPAYPQADKHKPSTLPDRVMLTWEGNPADSQSVTWRTDATVKTAQAQIAKAGEGPELQECRFDRARRPARRPTRPTSPTTPTYHTARFTGLESKTKYLYRLGDGTNWTEWYQFQTASANPEPFSFVYYGDAQNDVQEHWSRVVRESFKDAPDTKLFLHAGDLIDSSASDSQWGEWFRAGHWINGMVPSFATTGNHEYSGRDALAAVEPRLRVAAERPAGHGRRLRRAQGHRVLHGLPGRALHLDELQHRCRAVRQPRATSSASRPSGSRACWPTTRTSGPS